MMSYLVREETTDWHRVPPRAPEILMTPENFAFKLVLPLVAIFSLSLDVVPFGDTYSLSDNS